MPYSTISELPPGIKNNLPTHAQEIFMAAYNSAFKQHHGDEKISNSIAWAAVKTKYKKNEKGDWVAKEARISESMSMDDKRNLLQSAIEQKFPQPSTASKEVPWVVDIFDTELVYRADGEDYKVPYVLDSEEKVTFGEPIKVKRQTVYTSIESLRQKYAEIIHEVGRRNASPDAVRIKKIVELCQELLSSEETDEAKTKEAIKEADATIARLKEQPMVKTEDGVEFPSIAFAYVPDSEKPSTWKLRIWENLEKKVTRAQLGRAAAALSPGGFRGQRVQIPSDDLSAVKRKIRSAYRSLDIPDEEIPRWVQESVTRTLLTGYIPLTEAKFDKGMAKITVIQAGFNTSKDRYYPLDTLVRDHTVFEGLKMYADHPSESDEVNRPERSIRDWVATLKNVHIEEDKVVGDAQIIEPWMQEKLATLRDKNMLPEMGVSINAVGAASEATIEGTKTNYIERIARGRSVDFVTEAGAGGLVEMYEADRDIDIDFVSLNVFKERRPELVKEIETSVKNSLMKEVKKHMELEDKVTELTEANATLTTENETLKTAKANAEKAKLLAETKAIVETAIGKAELPEIARAKLLERFKDAVSADGLEAAIEAEKTYVATLSKAGEVRGLGSSGDPNPGETHEALIESIKRMHPEYTEEQIKFFIDNH